MVAILEGNKLIAEFMGWVHSVVNYHGINLFHYPEGDKSPIHCKQMGLEQMKYHYSWDWLMPVVSKINSLDYLNLWDDNNVDKYNLTESLKNVDIESTWELCVEFIKWYNSYDKLQINK